MNQSVLDSPVTLFDVREAVIWRTWGNRSLTSDKVFYGQIRQMARSINFYLKEPLADRENVTITIQDSAGQTVRTINCTRPNPNAPQQPPVHSAAAVAVADSASAAASVQCNADAGDQPVCLGPARTCGGPAGRQLPRAAEGAPAAAAVALAGLATRDFAWIRAHTRSRSNLAIPSSQRP